MADIREDEEKTGEKEEIKSDDAVVESTSDESQDARRDRRPVEGSSEDEATTGEAEVGGSNPEQGGV